MFLGRGVNWMCMILLDSLSISLVDDHASFVVRGVCRCHREGVCEGYVGAALDHRCLQHMG